MYVCGQDGAHARGRCHHRPQSSVLATKPRSPGRRAVPCRGEHRAPGANGSSRMPRADWRGAAPWPRSRISGRRPRACHPARPGRKIRVRGMFTFFFLNKWAKGEKKRSVASTVQYLVSEHSPMGFCSGGRWKIRRRRRSDEGGCAWREDAGQARSCAACVIARRPGGGGAGLA